MSAIDEAVRSRLNYLRRELEIAEREAAREPLGPLDVLPLDQRAPFDAVNRGIELARAAAPLLRAEIAELERDAPSP